MNQNFNHWGEDIENMLLKIHDVSNELSDYHKKKYYSYKNILKYFKIPIIICSSINSVIAVGMNQYLKQRTVSVINCILSLFIAIIGSIEIYLGIQKTMEIELDSSKEYKILAYDILKTLSIDRINRTEDGKEYLNTQYSKFIKLIESSTLTEKRLKKEMKFEDKINQSIESLNSSISSITNNTDESIVNNINIKPNNDIISRDIELGFVI